MSENIQLRFEWQCPHCGHNNVNYASLIGSFGQMGMQVIYCCVEDGGCDELVAVLPNAQVSAKVYKLVEAQATPKV